MRVICKLLSGTKVDFGDVCWSPSKQDHSSDHTGKDPSKDRNGNCRRTGGIPTRKGGKKSNHESQNTDAQGMRAPTTTTTLYVLCGLQEGVRLYLP